jgi:two-component system chemotaxis sensor kinase CheA
LATEAQLRAEELRAANEELEEQSEELQALNEEIKEKSEEIQTANQELEEKSNLLETQMQEVARKSADIEKISQYKSEFLANMSHELRTPLNSLLILSKSLEENREGNLTEQQVEAALVIHSGGQELLALINDILDLSKIEAGRLLPQWEPVVIANVLDYLRKQFEPVAQNKALTFEVLIEDEIPTTIITDEQRLVQILRNLLSNAFKFTSEGRVELRVEGDHSPGEGNGTGDLATIAFTISDTGIGIAEELLTSVFDAFQQGDGSTSRRYGGTGLGLTISRDLAELLGGQLSVQSRVGEGSRFTLHLPVSEAAAVSVVTAGSRPQSERRSLYEGDGPAVRSNSAPNDGSKWQLLVIGEGAFLQQTARELLAIENVNTTTASSGREGLALLQTRRFDCLVLDLPLSDIPGAELLKIIDETPSVTFPQTILCTEQELSGDELHALQRFSQTWILKGETAAQRLQEEVRLFSRKLENSQPPAPLPSERNPSETDTTLKGKKVLIVDDDVRNTYALSHALADRGLDVVMADNGQLALEILEQEDDVTLIVMDIMMPGMDGYEAMRRIREMKRYEKAPMIALTAKAMPEDRSKCISAGANDYLTKPVNTEELLSMMQTWLDSQK